MPTHEKLPLFERGHRRLSTRQLALFENRLKEFIADLLSMEAGQRTWFREGLRVKKVRGRKGVYEMTWDRDGRAIFEWGEEQVPGKRHIIWLDIGGHEILP